MRYPIETMSNDLKTEHIKVVQIGDLRPFIIYDLDKKVIAVFKKSTGKFVTTCELTAKENAELKATGNFGGGKGWFSGQAKNLSPQQTAVNTFESDIT